MESCFLELRNVTDDLHANGPVGIMTGYEEKFYALGTPCLLYTSLIQPLSQPSLPAPLQGEPFRRGGLTPQALRASSP